MTLSERMRSSEHEAEERGSGLRMKGVHQLLYTLVWYCFHNHPSHALSLLLLSLSAYLFLSHTHTYKSLFPIPLLRYPLILSYPSPFSSVVLSPSNTATQPLHHITPLSWACKRECTEEKDILCKLEMPDTTVDKVVEIDKIHYDSKAYHYGGSSGGAIILPFDLPVKNVT